MSRQFSLPTILRMVPNVLLREFFAQLGHGEFDPRWDELKEREIDPIVDYLNELPGIETNEVESALRSVFELACDSGFGAILEAAKHCGVTDLGLQAPEELSVYGRAMWAWLYHRQAFDKAQMIHQVDSLSWWRKRNDLPSMEPDTSSKAIARLEREISALLKSQGRGKDCTVETMTRASMDYFFAYPDDFVQNAVIHDEDGQLAPAAFRQTLLVVFAYDREEGSLETFAKLPKRLKEQLEVIFAENILHWDLGPHEPEAAYELNQLKDAAFELNTDPEDRLRVQVVRMRLSARYGGRRVILEVDKEDPHDHIHMAIAECLNLETMPLSEWNVTLVTFCFEFLSLDGRKPGRQSFDVSFPRSCGLRNARPERVEIIQKNLKRWRIECVAAPDRCLVAVGD